MTRVLLAILDELRRPDDQGQVSGMQFEGRWIRGGGRVATRTGAAKPTYGPRRRTDAAPGAARATHFQQHLRTGSPRRPISA